MANIEAKKSTPNIRVVASKLVESNVIIFSIFNIIQWNLYKNGHRKEYDISSKWYITKTKWYFIASNFPGVETEYFYGQYRNTFDTKQSQV